MSHVQNHRSSSLNSATTSVVISIPHASAARPFWLPGLGEDELFATHEAADLGIADLGKVLARGLRSEIVQADVSRLFIDVNRPLAEKAIPRHAFDGLILPFNVNLTPGDLAARLRKYQDFHRQLAARLTEAMAAAKCVWLIDLHSFTRRLGNAQRRVVDVGVCIPKGSRLGPALVDALSSVAATGGFPVIDDSGVKRTANVRADEPYAGTHPGAFVSSHYQSECVDTVTIEVCNDLLSQPLAIAHVSRLLTGSVAMIQAGELEDLV